MLHPTPKGFLAAISTHALREEGDASLWRRGFFFLLFLPTPSVRRATQQLATAHAQ